MVQSEELIEQLTPRVHQALKQYHSGGLEESPFSTLALFQLTLRKGASSPRQAANEVLHRALDHLNPREPDSVELLRMRFLDRMSSQETANALNLAESTTNTRQRTAIKQLAEAIAELDASPRAEHQAKLEKRLEPMSNIGLVGVEEIITQVSNYVDPGNAPWIVAIEGLGGLGKTTVADALMRQIIPEGTYMEIGWVTARQERLNLGGAISFIEEPALTAGQLVERLFGQLFPELLSSASNNAEQMLDSLRRRLKEIPHLVVVDNLETITDLDNLLPTIQTLVNPSKFLLTSRVRTYNEPNICHYSLPELSEGSSLALIRQEANVRNLPELADSPKEDLIPIYKSVGGNPLALRLVVGQTHIHPLGDILSDLQQARGEPIENLYTYIYRRIWDSLDELNKRVFLAMVLVPPSGMDSAYLAEVSSLSVDEVRLALNGLVTRNLVDARGDYSARRYTIHSLTRTFLQEQVAKWDATLATS